MDDGGIRDLASESFIRKHCEERSMSARSKYQLLVTGRTGLTALIQYEVISTVTAYIPGALGIIIRRLCYRCLLGHMGKDVVIGHGVILRHADRIKLGDGVIIDDNCVLDARGAKANGLVIEDGVIIGRGVTVQCKAGDIAIGRESNVGAHSLICAMGGVEIGEAALIGGGCKISGGMYHTSDSHRPIMKQGVYTRGPVRIEAGVWLGMGSMVLDAVTIGRGAVLGAGAVATHDIPEYAVAVGVPARVLRVRHHSEIELERSMR